MFLVDDDSVFDRSSLKRFLVWGLLRMQFSSSRSTSVFQDISIFPSAEFLQRILWRPKRSSRRPKQWAVHYFCLCLFFQFCELLCFRSAAFSGTLQKFCSIKLTNNLRTCTGKQLGILTKSSRNMLLPTMSSNTLWRKFFLLIKRDMQSCKLYICTACFGGRDTHFWFLVSHKFLTSAIWTRKPRKFFSTTSEDVLRLKLWKFEQVSQDCFLVRIFILLLGFADHCFVYFLAFFKV